MERAHVLIRLRNCDDESSSVAENKGVASPNGLCVTPPKPTGVCRTSPTTVRLEHSDMSPGVASITFEQVYDQRHDSNEIFQQSLEGCMARVADGYAMTLVATGASHSGKSFTMHGDSDNESSSARSVGLIELAIARVFSAVHGDFQVLVACCYTDKSKNALVDACTGRRMMEKEGPVDTSGEAAFLSVARRVASVEEATRVYRKALGEMPKGGESDFVCVVFVETLGKSGAVNRGRLVCIDIHGNGIIEPYVAHSNQDETGSPAKPSLFADTQFPVSQPLTEWCGSFLGNDAATFIVVTINSAARKQQQAIQSLLYACKAKDIKSSLARHEVSSFTNSEPMPEVGSTLPTAASEDEDGELMFLGSPVYVASSDSSGSTVSLLQSKTSSVQQSSADLLSERLRQAYQSVKKSATTPAPVRVSVGESVVAETNVSMQTLHSRADAILRQASSAANLDSMTLLEKLDSIRSLYEEMDKSLKHEMSVKQKCVERISKLSQTMSFQVVEHEKQLHAKDAENNGLRGQLEEMQAKYDDAEQTLERLQQQVEALRQATRDRASSSKSPVKMSNERKLLQQFSARLETAMLEAKSVVDHKDAIIRDMETRLVQFEVTNNGLEEQLRKGSAALEKQVAQFAAERRRWEEQTTELRTELSTSHTQRDKYRGQLTDATRKCEALEREWRVKTEMLQRALEESSQQTLQQHNQEIVRLEATVKELQESSQQTQQQHDEEMARLEATVRELKQQLREQDRELQRTLLKSVATDAALCSSTKRVADVETELEDVKTKLNKDKKKLEKKLRILMTERKQQMDETEKAESELSEEVQRLGLELVAVHSERAAQENELERRQQLINELESRATRAEQQDVVSQEQIAVLQDCVQQLESDKQSLEEELDARTYSLEQSMARRLSEQESQLYAEFERQLKDTMERHTSELLQRDLELNRLRNRVRAQAQPPVPVLSAASSSLSSSAASSASMSDHIPPQQHDLDQLDAMLDGGHHKPPRSKKGSDPRTQDKLSKQKHKITMLRQQIDSLTHALAIANEQETLAKQAIEQLQAQYQRMMYAQEELQTQVNTLKHENWSLSWALQVTERRNLLTDSATTSAQIET